MTYADGTMEQLVTRSCKRQRMTPVLSSLSCLPVIYIQVCAYEALRGTAPQYLGETLVAFHPTRSRKYLFPNTAAPQTRGGTCDDVLEKGCLNHIEQLPSRHQHV